MQYNKELISNSIQFLFIYCQLTQIKLVYVTCKKLHIDIS